LDCYTAGKCLSDDCIYLYYVLRLLDQKTCLISFEASCKIQVNEVVGACQSGHSYRIGTSDLAAPRWFAEHLLSRVSYHDLQHRLQFSRLATRDSHFTAPRTRQTLLVSKRSFSGFPTSIVCTALKQVTVLHTCTSFWSRYVILTSFFHLSPFIAKRVPEDYNSIQVDELPTLS
jgi:hypothetical protein